jgi:redox-sensitive bicupin YhaK (pirin superfamily)
VNLPAAYKMSKPKYQAIKHANMPVVNLADNSGVVEVIAGNYQETAGGASTFSPIEVYNVRLTAGGRVSFDLPEGHNTGILIVEGSVLVNGVTEAKADQFVYFKSEGREIDIKAGMGSVLLVLSGAPINEPIAQYGPFLMNKPEEIQQAIADYNEGRFGYLEE